MSDGRYEETPGYGSGAPPPQSDAYGYGAAPPDYGDGQAGSYGDQSTYGYGQAVPNGGQSSNGYGSYGAKEVSPSQAVYGTSSALTEAGEKHKQQEKMIALGTAVAGAFALYEHYREKVDPVNAQRHRVEATVGQVAALGLGGYSSLYEYYKGKKRHPKVRLQQTSEGGHHHGHHHKQWSNLLRAGGGASSGYIAASNSAKHAI